MVDGRINLHPLVAAGVWERLFALLQKQGVQLGMTFLDGTSIRADQKAAGAVKKADTAAQRDPGDALDRCRGGCGTKSPLIPK